MANQMGLQKVHLSVMHLAACLSNAQYISQTQPFQFQYWRLLHHYRNSKTETLQTTEEKQNLTPLH
jgi:hypothetical protein